MGHSSPLKYSQSIHDLSHIPERDKWNSGGVGGGGKKQTGNNAECTDPYRSLIETPIDFNEFLNTTTNTTSSSHSLFDLPSSSSVPKDLQLCGCYMQDIVRNTSQLSHLFNTAAHSTTTKPLLSHDLVVCEQKNAVVRPKKLELTKYKLHKSLPVSPVSEERQFSDFIPQPADKTNRKSFSYFIELNESTNDGFRRVCRDIERFSRDFTKKNDEIEMTKSNQDGGGGDDDDGNFSSDSLEDYSFRSVNLKTKRSRPPRRCMSANTICQKDDDQNNDVIIPQSASFYLNQGNSQDSILSSDRLDASCCNSMESLLSNDSDCRSAPLEALFATQKQMKHSLSLPTYDFQTVSAPVTPKKLKTTQTQTDFDSPRRGVAKKNTSVEFQEKLLKFESKQPISFFVEGKNNKICQQKTDMYIPSLDSKNRQYKSRFCNVLNNKPEFDTNIFVVATNSSISAKKFEKNTNRNQETSSLDRHLFTKGCLLNDREKVCHKPPKAVRRHSSKSRKNKITYEYIKKEDFYNIKKTNNKQRMSMNNVTDENTIEISYKENHEDEVNSSNDVFLTELYDSLDKSLLMTNKIDQDSLELNLNQSDCKFDSLETESVNFTSCTSDKFKNNRINDNNIQFVVENMKILNEIQRKIQKINALVDIFKKNISEGKVRVLSSMYEKMTSSKSFYNDLSPVKKTFRRRNLSLPCFVERRLNFDSRTSVVGNKTKEDEEGDLYLL